MSLDISKIYMIKNKTKSFTPETLVRFVTCSYSGNCYLVENLKDDEQREWIMYWDIFPLDWTHRVKGVRFYFDEVVYNKAHALLKDHQAL